MDTRGEGGENRENDVDKDELLGEQGLLAPVGDDGCIDEGHILILERGTAQKVAPGAQVVAARTTPSSVKVQHTPTTPTRTSIFSTYGRDCFRQKAFLT